MALFVITTIEKKGDDIVFNDVCSVPKVKITWIKRTNFCSAQFDQLFYAEQAGVQTDHFDIFPSDVTMPAAVTDNESLFTKLVMLKL